MTKTKSTRRALLSSALALLLCVSMLVGSTFAWFTDSVTSGSNKIVSGKLDIELEYWNGTSWKTVENTTDLFSKDALWEPGYTEVVYLKLSNVGNLAAKYQFGIDVVSETEGTNVVGDTFKLSDHIYFGVLEGSVNGDTPVAYANRDAAIAAVGESVKINEGFVDTGYFVDNSALYMNVVVYMPTWVGNEANYRGDVVPTIDLALTAVAIQKDYESDSFGDDYDEGLDPTVCYVSNYDDLKTALMAGKTAVLMADFTAPKHIVVADGAVLDLNGHTITVAYDDGRFLAVQNGVSFEIKGDGEIVYDESVSSTYSDPIYLSGEGSTATINGGTYTMLSAGSKDYDMYLQNWSSLIINEGTFTNTSTDPLIYANWGATVTINGGYFESVGATNPDLLDVEYHYSRISTITITGGVFVNYDPAGDNEGDRVVVAEGHKSVGVAQANGDVWYYVVPEDTTVVATAAEFTSALSAADTGDTVMLGRDIDCGATQLQLTKDVTVDLGGNTLTNSNGHIGIAMSAGSVKNGIINYTGNVGAISVRGSLGSIEDVTINGAAPKTGKTITGIQLVNGGGSRAVEAIRNVTVTGVNQGIEVKDCSPNSTTTPAIGVMENVTVDATDVGMIINGYVGEIKNCDIKGANIGINMLLKGEYRVGATLVDCTVTGAAAGLWAHDEVGISNTTNCSFTLTYDADTVFNGGLVWEFEDECAGVLTLNKPA